MISLSPKTLFQQNADSSKAWNAIVHNTHFQLGLSAALAEFSQSSTASQEKLSGVKQFIETMLNLCQQPEPPRRLPQKTLNHHAAELVDHPQPAKV